MSESRVYNIHVMNSQGRISAKTLGAEAYRRLGHAGSPKWWNDAVEVLLYDGPGNTEPIERAKREDTLNRANWTRVKGDIKPDNRICPKCRAITRAKDTFEGLEYICTNKECTRYEAPGESLEELLEWKRAVDAGEITPRYQG